MRTLLRRIPQLQRLAVFDAVASTGGFTAAATELGVSQPAVSRHIALLERQVGLAVFERTAGGAHLTDAGQRLADAVAEAFGRIERELERLDQRRDTVVLAVQPTMATSWIVPNLDRIKAAADRDIRLWIYDRAGELDAAEWDLVIRPGAGAWPQLTSTLLFSEAVRPLASATLAADLARNGVVDPADLAGAALLHIDDIERPSMTWPQWFAAVGCDVDLPEPSVIYDSYPTMLHEALVGRGVVLGWRHLLGDLVERALLIPVGPEVERAEVGQYICWRDDHDQADRLGAVRDWLVDRIATAASSCNG